MIKLAKIISTFFGLGLFPLAPGTLASLVIIILYKYFLFRLSWPFYLVIVILITAAGVYFSTIYSRRLSLKDPGKIVIDEVSGQLLAVFLIKPDWIILVICFALFRFLDIIKPMGIKKLENLPEGWGIMADDLGSGLLVSIVVHLSLWLF
ncbi:MAG: phosphatidylglycerophosphatase A [Acidobacteriota bacterium]|nr:phosphatidylglycerophosphatase A [Acidobacteriota bacterium]MDW3228595.1 phosphatidylglycerophosphatase A [Acidobacteriota bacterium]